MRIYALFFCFVVLSSVSRLNQQESIQVCRVLKFCRLSMLDDALSYLFSR